MRQLFPDQHNDNIYPVDDGLATKDDLTALANRFETLLQDFTNLQTLFDTYKQELGEALTTDNITSTTATIATLTTTLAQLETLTADTITTDTIKVLKQLTTDTIEAVSATLQQLTILQTITTSDISATTAVIDTLKATTAEITNWTITHLQVEDITADTITTKSLDTESLTSPEATIDTLTSTEATIDKITSPEADVDDLTVQQLTTSQIVWKEEQTVVDADTFYIETPHFENGNYYIKAITEDDKTLCTVEISNSINNFYFRYSQIELGYIERAYTTPTAKLVFRIKNLSGQQIRLLFCNISSTNVGAPNTYEEYPYPVDITYTIDALNGSKYFSKLDLVQDGVTLGALELKYSSDFKLIDTATTYYDTTSNESYTSYLPDQSVNTLDDVQFNSVTAPVLGIENAEINRKIEAPNIYNGPELTNANKLHDDTLYIPNEAQINYTDWAFKIDGVSEYTDNFTQACNGYDWSRTKYAGFDIDFGTAQNVTQITDYDYYAIVNYNTRYYLLIGNTVDNTANICQLSIDTTTGALSFINKLFNSNKDVYADADSKVQLTLADLVDYDNIYIGDRLMVYRVEVIYTDVQLYTANNIQYITSKNKLGSINRKTTDEHGNAVVAEIIPINNNTKANYIKGQPLTYNPDTREITADDSLAIQQDLHVLGDLYVSGTTHTTDTEDIVASGDTLVLRANNNSGLATGELSGIIINKYNGTEDLALVTDSDGTLRVGTEAGVPTTYNNILYDEHTRQWYEYTIDSGNNITVGNTVVVAGEATSWTNRRVQDDYTVYDSITFTVIDKQSLVPLLGRAEEADMTDGDVLVFDKTKLIAKTEAITDVLAKLPNDNGTPVDTDYVVTQVTKGSEDTPTNEHGVKKTFAAIWVWIKNKIETILFDNFNTKKLSFRNNDTDTVSKIITKDDASNTLQVADNPDSSATHSYSFIDYNLWPDNGQYYDDPKHTILHNFYIPVDATNVMYTASTPNADDTVNVTITYDLTVHSVQQLATIDTDASDQSLVYYDAQSKEQKTVELPTDQSKPLVPVLQGGRVNYREYTSGNGDGDANNWSGTTDEYTAALAITDEYDDGYIKDRSGVDIFDYEQETMFPVSSIVQEGDLNPVNSNAVAEAIKDAMVLDWKTLVDVTANMLPAGATYPSGTYKQFVADEYGMIFFSWQIERARTAADASVVIEMNSKRVVVVTHEGNNNETASFSSLVKPGDYINVVISDHNLGFIRSYCYFVPFKYQPK